MFKNFFLLFSVTVPHGRSSWLPIGFFLHHTINYRTEPISTNHKPASTMRM